MRFDEDFVGGLGPDEGFAAFVTAVDERLDGGLEFFDAGEAAARMAWRVMMPKGTVALSVRVLAQQEIFLWDTSVRPLIDLSRLLKRSGLDLGARLAEPGRRSCGASVARWRNATVPVEPVLGLGLPRVIIKPPSIGVAPGFTTDVPSTVYARALVPITVSTR